MPRADQQRRPSPRNSYLKARATQEDVELVETVASRLGLPTASYIRAVVLDAARGAGRVSTTSRLEQDPALSLTESDRRRIDLLRAEIHRCGVNLNQLVRLAHRGEVRSTALAASVEELADLCRSTVEELGGRAL